METMKFNFVSKPNQKLVKNDDDGDQIDIFDHFDTSNSDDYIAGYLKVVDYDKGVFKIVGEISEDKIKEILSENSYLRGGEPNIYDVKQRIDILDEEWDIEWETYELKDEDDEII